jgi:5-(aminomethyl)-3-furanmethanol phosphate kinase
MTKNRCALFKIGGKILDNKTLLENTISQITNLYVTYSLDKIIVVPGGGTLANFIRFLDLNMNIGDEMSHWMAIQAMNFNGQELATRYKQIEVFEKIEDIRNREQIFAIFLPFNYLKNNDLLPHNWQVTSDSIALYLAHELNFERVFLIKNIDGIIRKDNSCIEKISTLEFKELKKDNQLKEIESDKFYNKNSTPVDDYLVDLIDEYKVPCIILNGVKPTGITDFFLKKSEICCTQIIPTNLDK